ncbi:unnamed protein product [Pleuronectes platessa]|uniref:Uncharacterized protein n=1 Tax=Pleuronectes platessa TaxID=8262 RepID=A0A9N7YMS1_PLEPL|nr:unnamed protein product [Pleuronectes platessa]
MERWREAGGGETRRTGGPLRGLRREDWDEGKTDQEGERGRFIIKIISVWKRTPTTTTTLLTQLLKLRRRFNVETVERHFQREEGRGGRVSRERRSSEEEEKGEEL